MRHRKQKEYVDVHKYVKETVSVFFYYCMEPVVKK